MAVQLGAVVVVEVVADLQRVRVDNGAQLFKVHGKGAAVFLAVGGEVGGGVLRGIRGVDKRHHEGQRVDERVALAGSDAGEFLKAEFIDKARRDRGICHAFLDARVIDRRRRVRVVVGHQLGAVGVAVDEPDRHALERIHFGDVGGDGVKLAAAGLQLLEEGVVPHPALGFVRPGDRIRIGVVVDQHVALGARFGVRVGVHHLVFRHGGGDLRVDLRLDLRVGEALLQRIVVRLEDIAERGSDGRAAGAQHREGEQAGGKCGEAFCSFHCTGLLFLIGLWRKLHA